MSQNKHEIALDQAVSMITSFRTQLPKMLQPGYENALPYSETFDKSVFEQLTAASGCTSIRAYLGMDDQKQVRLIFASVTADGSDVLPESGGALFEVGARCPPECGIGPLNPTTT
jgi:hypothetical protein